MECVLDKVGDTVSKYSQLEKWRAYFGDAVRVLPTREGPVVQAPPAKPDMLQSLKALRADLSNVSPEMLRLKRLRASKTAELAAKRVLC
jgi:hypothetical protein